VTRRGCAGAAAAVVATAALLAACQPLPHPFEDDKPPSALLKVRDTITVTIAPIVGDPAPVAAKLGDAVAQTLQKQDVAASSKTASLGSYQLYGRVVPERAGRKPTTGLLKAIWRLYAPNGKLVAERTVGAKAKPADWSEAKDSAIEKLAVASAANLAPLFFDDGPKQVSVDENAGRTRVAIGKIAGAPGDGTTALAGAIAAVLKRQELAIVAPNDKADLVVEGDVTVDPVKANKQHVKIVWRVKRPGGAEIGTIGQENDVPRGTLDGAWGDLAYSVATAASDGLLQVIARGTPEPAPTPPRQAAAAPAR
jgi:hypothetical protein